MTIEEIREIIKAVVDSGVAELEVQRGDNRVKIKRSTGMEREVVVHQVAAPAPVMATHQPVHVPAPPPVVVAAPSVPTGVGAVAPTADPTLLMVKAPIVGTFYQSPSPDSPPFVRVGDSVKPGQVLCIIESMKLMNEIECEVSGTVVARLVENGSPVEYGEALFSIKPH